MEKSGRVVGSCRFTRSFCTAELRTQMVQEQSPGWVVVMSCQRLPMHATPRMGRQARTNIMG